MKAVNSPKLQRSLILTLCLLMSSTALLTASSHGEQSSGVKVFVAGSHIRYVEPTSNGSGKAQVAAMSSSADAAQSKLATYASYFGVTDPTNQLEQLDARSFGKDAIIRYRQMHRGLPVIGADLVMALDQAGELKSLSGKYSPRIQLPVLSRQISASDARRTAAVVAAKYHKVSMTALMTDEPELSVYDPALIGPASNSMPQRVWAVIIKSVAPLPINHLVLIDAANGGVVLSFNQAETARNRLTYTANNTSIFPGTLLCNESQPLCTNGVNPDADRAHRYAGQTYDFYFTHYARDSYDNLGATLVASVQYSGFCPNAAWTGTQMIYCSGAAADDVVAHELTHAVTQSTSRLYYYYQSGAINESLSDLWGEFVDLTNGEGTDTPAVRWKQGEDFVGLGVIRDMANPPAYGDPDRMRSTLYWTSAGDNGGVHTNSGVNNKAATLMVDGGSFNGYTITGIGLDKVAAIYYRVQTQHLTSGSDYADLYLALNLACRNLIGSNGIVANDCVQVANAANAVEMNLEPALDANTEAPLCSPNQAASNTYFDGFEGGTNPANWTSINNVGGGIWAPVTVYSASGLASYGTGGSASISDFSLTMTGQVAIPPGAYLRFRHSFDQEFAATTVPTYNDGGVLEYSINNGVTWSDAASLYSAGRNYTGVLSGGTGNPLAGRNAFVGSSHGYVSTRYNLSSLAGNSIKIRFRNSSDSSIQSGRAWVVDDVQIYTCATDPSPNAPPVANAGSDLITAPLRNVLLDASNSSDSDGLIVSAQWTQISGPLVSVATTARTLSFVTPVTPTQEILTFRLTITDNRGATNTDDLTVTVVNQQPVVNAGLDSNAKPRAGIALTGSATDVDGVIGSYVWAQISGPIVTLVGAGTNTLSFVAPSVPTTAILVFRLTATDNLGGTGTDDVSVMVSNSQPTASAGADIAVEPGVAVSLTGSGTDSDGAVSSFQWTQIGGPAVNLSASNSSATSFSAPSSADQGALIFRLTVTDNDGGVASDDVAVTIRTAAKSGGGGGSIELWWLFMLFGLLLLTTDKSANELWRH